MPSTRILDLLCPGLPAIGVSVFWEQVSLIFCVLTAHAAGVVRGNRYVSCFHFSLLEQELAGCWATVLEGWSAILGSFFSLIDADDVIDARSVLASTRILDKIPRLTRWDVLDFCNRYL